jgi:hypothetical protein
MIDVGLGCRWGASGAMAVQLTTGAPVEPTEMDTYLGECCVRGVEAAAGVSVVVEQLWSSPA